MNRQRKKKRRNRNLRKEFNKLIIDYYQTFRHLKKIKFKSIPVSMTLLKNATIITSSLRLLINYRLFAQVHGQV